MSARSIDTNGWFTAKDNPISLVGVFPYRGRSINADLDPERLYQVFRPEEELSNVEALESFKLLPWIDDHEMLGEDWTDALDKGVAGVTGESVWFDPGLGKFGGVRSNIKCFSEAHAEELDAGKRELSAGYRCVYDFTPGVFNGIAYDVIQRTLRGNHLASVDDGRMGSIVAVLDDNTDLKEQPTVTQRTKGRAKPRQLTAADLSRINASPAVAAAMVAALDASEEAEDETTTTTEDTKAEDALSDIAGDEDDETKAEDALSDIPGKDEDDDDETKAEDEMPAALKKANAEDTAPAMDEAEFVVRLSRRNALARDLKPVVGAFDHSEMTLDAVADYGVKKLKLRGVPKGQEALAARMYLAGRSSVAGSARSAAATGMDAADATPKSGYIARLQAK